MDKLRFAPSGAAQNTWAKHGLHERPILFNGGDSEYKAITRKGTGLVSIVSKDYTLLPNEEMVRLADKAATILSEGKEKQPIGVRHYSPETINAIMSVLSAQPGRWFKNEEIVQAVKMGTSTISGATKVMRERGQISYRLEGRGRSRRALYAVKTRAVTLAAQNPVPPVEHDVDANLKALDDEERKRRQLKRDA